MGFKEANAYLNKKSLENEFVTAKELKTRLDRNFVDENEREGEK